MFIFHDVNKKGHGGLPHPLGYYVKSAMVKHVRSPWVRSSPILNFPRQITEAYRKFKLSKVARLVQNQKRIAANIIQRAVKNKIKSLRRKTGGFKFTFAKPRNLKYLSSCFKK